LKTGLTILQELLQQQCSETQCRARIAGEESTFDDFWKISQHEHWAFGIGYIGRKLELLCWTERFVAFQD
jgi:hypothetical protein